MTKKRFTVKDDVGMLDVACANIFDNGEFIGTVPLFDAEKFVDLLNEQYKTIQRLQKNITELLSMDIEKELLKENEQLKTVINRYEKYSNKKNDELNFKQLDILKLKEENEQLKSENNKLNERISILEGKFNR